MGESEVARIRRRIELEYEASRRIFTDFTPTARHEYITQRQENIEKCYQELTKIVLPEEAMTIVIQAENSVYGSSASSGKNA